MKEKKIGSLAIVVSIVIFGLNFVSMKILVEYIPTLGLVFLRFLIASIFLTIIMKVKFCKNDLYKEVHKKDKNMIFLTGILGIVIYYCCQTLALNYMSASLAALICAMIPIFTLLTKVIIYKDKLEKFLLVNFLVSLVGVFMVLDKNIKDFLNSTEIIGCALMFVSVFSWIAYTMKTYELQKKYDSLYLISKQTTVATIFLFFVSIFDFPKIIISFKQVDILPCLLENLIFVGVVCSALGYFFYIYGMEKVGVEVAALYMNLIPVVTAFGSYFILDEMMNGYQILGIVIVLLCLVSVSYRDWVKSKKARKAIYINN